MHHNSVRYRVAKIQDLLGVEFTADNQLAPRLALHLTDRLSPWALSR
ncbi:helix-turn-helix domain-containing protein [Gordonia phosphorivorans]|uniref:Helix-turn-helix domain-containing protein n=1 Tax=Gordonia phosphorivorans TaxID=1056982 RepID=A0ABV6H5G6_9ACTN